MDRELLTYFRKEINEYFYQNRPTWDIYFLNLAINVAYRSEDLFIKHGAVIVNKDHHIMGTGYNGLIRGGDKTIIPIKDREERRKWCIHAEENAILNCPHNDGSYKIYITGEPCNNCLQRIVNFGIKEVVTLDGPGSSTEDESSREMKEQIIQMAGLEIRKIPLKDLLME